MTSVHCINTVCVKGDISGLQLSVQICFSPTAAHALLVNDMKPFIVSFSTANNMSTTHIIRVDHD